MLVINTLAWYDLCEWLGIKQQVKFYLYSQTAKKRAHMLNTGSTATSSTVLVLVDS